MGSFQPKLMTKIEIISQKPSKNWIFGKNVHFLTLFGQKILNFEFSHGYHYSHMLVDTYEKTLGSFHPKLMTKIEVISQKPSKNWIFGKNGHFLTVFGQNGHFFNFSQKSAWNIFYTP